MKNNKLICLFIGILIGFLAKAGEKAQASGHTDGSHTTVHVITEHSNSNIEVNASFKCKVPEQKARKIRPRFRGVSFFTLQQISGSTQSGNLLRDITSLLPTGNQAPALPFYYIFLFRLTPF